MQETDRKIDDNLFCRLGARRRSPRVVFPSLSLFNRDQINPPEGIRRRLLLNHYRWRGSRAHPGHDCAAAVLRGSFCDWIIHFFLWIRLLWPNHFPLSFIIHVSRDIIDKWCLKCGPPSHIKAHHPPLNFDCIQPERVMRLWPKKKWKELGMDPTLRQVFPSLSFFLLKNCDNNCNVFSLSLSSCLCSSAYNYSAAQSIETLFRTRAEGREK